MLTGSLIFKGEAIRLRDVACTSRYGPPGGVEAESIPKIIFPRYGAFAYHFARHDEHVADANTAIALAPSTPFKVSHPGDSGDECTVIEPCDELPKAVLFRGLPISIPTSRLMHQARAVAIHGGSSFFVEESATRALSQMFSEKIVLRRSSARTVERVKSMLAEDPGADMTLRGIARAVAVSPFHLVRVFRAATGMTLHQYRISLRLKLGLRRIALGEPISAVALDCGFASHSHFTSAFRKHFGSVPSALGSRNQRSDTTGTQ